MKRLLSILIALISICPSRATAESPDLVCRDARSPDVPANVCTGARGVIQPCVGVVVPQADLVQAGRDRAALIRLKREAAAAAKECSDLAAVAAKECSDLAAVAEKECAANASTDAAAHAAQIKSVEERAERERALAAFYLAETKRVQAEALEASSWGWENTLATIVAGTAAVVSGIRCATTEEAGWCAVTGLALGFGIGFSL